MDPQAAGAHKITLMTLRSLYLVAVLFIGLLAALAKGAGAPSADVRAMCGAIKKQDHRTGEVCREYGYQPES